MSQIVGIQISHNSPGRVAGVPDDPRLGYAEHNAGSINCWCRPLIEPLIVDADGQIRAVERS